jgi:hypothetical protein
MPYVSARWHDDGKKKRPKLIAIKKKENNVQM